VLSVKMGQPVSDSVVKRKYTMRLLIPLSIKHKNAAFRWKWGEKRRDTVG
jgi:hypothetical protein